MNFIVRIEPLCTRSYLYTKHQVIIEHSREKWNLRNMNSWLRIKLLRSILNSHTGLWHSFRWVNDLSLVEFIWVKSWINLSQLSWYEFSWIYLSEKLRWIDLIWIEFNRVDLCLKMGWIEMSFKLRWSKFQVELRWSEFQVKLS